MFVADKLVYLQLPKAASTFITSVLSKNMDGQRIGHHTTLDSRPDGSIIISSIRNPWDWYVSLWAFGCSGHGGVWKKLNRRNERRPDLWRECYSDANDPNKFRRWLQAFMNPSKSDQWKFYPQIPMRGVAGIYTYRLLKMTSLTDHWAEQSTQLRSPADIERHFETASVVDRFVRCESLRTDLEAIIEDAGLPPLVFPADKRNASEHAAPNYYYDEESIELIRSRDPLIVETFGYAGPSVD